MVENDNLTRFFISLVMLFILLFIIADKWDEIKEKIWSLYDRILIPTIFIMAVIYYCVLIIGDYIFGKIKYYFQVNNIEDGKILVLTGNVKK